MFAIPIDYETLRLIWWVLLGVLLIGFAVMGGMDLGVGTLLPFIARNDEERRVVINVSGPTWEGNQVWLVVAGGTLFAAWPAVYAVSFSGLYLAMIAILLALILRPLGFAFRGKFHDPRWRSGWDWVLFIGGFLPALIFGIAVGNTLLGLPFKFDATLRIAYTGNFFELFHPFAILAGLVSVAMLVTQGAVVLAMRTRGIIAERARRYGKLAALATIVLFALGGLACLVWISGYRLTSVPDMAGPSNPLAKTVSMAPGAWGANYSDYPITIIAPALAFLGAIVAFLALHLRRYVVAILGSSLAIAAIIATAGLSMFPFLLPSSIDAKSSLTVWDASSSQMTLFIMLIVTVFFLPLILIYTSWAFHVMRGPVTAASVDKTPHAY